MNLLDASTFKITDRKAILRRIQAALQRDPACRFDFKGTWKEATPDENANWDARQCLLRLTSAFPVDKPLESLGAQEESRSPEGDLAHTPDQIAEA
jgi:hypothetical protein